MPSDMVASILARVGSPALAAAITAAATEASDAAAAAAAASAAGQVTAAVGSPGPGAGCPSDSRVRGAGGRRADGPAVRPAVLKALPPESVPEVYLRARRAELANKAGLPVRSAIVAGVAAAAAKQKLASQATALALASAQSSAMLPEPPGAPSAGGPALVAAPDGKHVGWRIGLDQVGRWTIHSTSTGDRLSACC
jgi:hypothetical protein